MKGLSGAVLESETDTVLRSVNLSGSGDRKAGGYSGGMKRRLSVANSLIGNPDFLLQELQRIRLELVTKEEQLQTAAVLGEQLIAYNEELEETHRQMSNTNNTQNLKDTCSFDRRNEPSLSIDLPIGKGKKNPGH